MKIAIQGHSTRGKEVIQILESLGGINRLNHNGHYTNYFYYVAGDDNTIAWTCVRPQYRDVFTLEEFEKEFPFKIGDKIKHITSIGIIKEYCYIDNEPAYKVESMELGIIANIPAKILEPYKEMEIRNITLTLDKAKEWYKKGGELREIALQAFTEKELNPLPRSWEEFATNYARRGYYISSDGKPLMCASSGKFSSPHVCPSKKSAEAHLALIQLEQLRNCWWNGWEPIWDCSEKWCIRLWGNELTIGTTKNISRFLTFPTKEMAEEFLKCFRDLIEQAGDLI